MRLEGLLIFIEQFKFELWTVLFLGTVALLVPLVFMLEDIRATNNTSFVYASNSEEKTKVQKLTNPTAITKAGEAEGAEAERSSITRAAASVQSGSKTVWPMNGRVSVEFGVPHRPWQRRHTGIDIWNGQRNGVVASFKKGVVTKTISGSRNGYGKYVIIAHGDNLTSQYAHLSTITVKEGQHVNAGDIIGREGRTGSATGTHLHFEVRRRDAPVNPRLYIRGSP